MANLALAGSALLAFDAGAQATVSKSGQPSFTLPIAVPPGLGHLTPSVALSFSGDSASGPLGTGWKLSGLSAITRCPATKSVDGFSRGVTFTGDDKLCLDGQRLIQTNDQGAPLSIQGADARATANPREFRTEVDSFSRIRAGAASGNNEDGPGTFYVYGKNGLTYQYGGSTSDGTVQTVYVQGRNMIAVWPLVKVSDSVGNFMEFKYLQTDPNWGSGPVGGQTWTPKAGHEWLLSEIAYTGGLGIVPTSKVSFIYSGRVDDSGKPRNAGEAYHLGNKNVSTQLLTQIRTFVGVPPVGSPADKQPVPAKTYKLAYDTGPVSGRSRLSTITECSGANENACLPPTRMGYTSGGADRYSASSRFNGQALASKTLRNTAGTYGVLLGDFDADGKTDLIRWSDTPSENELWLSDGDGGFAKASTSFTENLVKSDGCYYSVVADVNGDGLPDIFRYSASTDVNGKTCASYGAVRVYMNAGNATFNAVNYSGPALSRKIAAPWQNFVLLDVNGDGKVDIVQANQPHEPGAGGACDGMVCGRVFIGDGTGRFEEKATNLAQQPVMIPPVPGTTAGSGYVSDVDGDGLPDLTTSMSFAGSWLSYRSKGDNNFEGVYAGACAYNADVNGDGRPDCLNPEAKTLSISDGRSQFSTPSFNLGSEELASASAGVVVADINRDGRYDLIRWKDSAADNKLFLSNGDGTFRASDTFGLTSDVLKTGSGSVDFVTGDFRGYGAVEILRMGPGSSNALYLKDDVSPPDLLTSVTTPLGQKTTFTYEPLSHSARYTSGRAINTAQLPVVDVTPPIWTVVTATTDSGVGTAQVTHEYAYKGLRAHVEGRGLLGFMEVREQQPGADGSLVSSGTAYLQQAPYIGMPSIRRTWTGGMTSVGTELSRTTTSYCDTTSATSPSGVTDGVASVPCPSASLVKRPYVYESLQITADTNGAELPAVRTTTTMNQWGDVLTSKVVTTSRSTAGSSQGFTRTVTHEVCEPRVKDTTPLCPSKAPNPNRIDGNYWVIGRITQTTEQRQDNPPTITTSAGNAPYASSRGGSAPKPTITVTRSPQTMVADKPFTVAWNTTNATSATYDCTASGTGYSDRGAASVPTGSAPGTADIGWVGYPSRCTWTATNAAGDTATFTETLTTIAPPVISVSRTPMIAGQTFMVTWSATNARELSFTCNAAGTGYRGTYPVPTSGSAAGPADAAWVSYPSSCVWTAVSPEGLTTTFNETLVTGAAQPDNGTPKIAVNRSPAPMRSRHPFVVTWATTNAKDVGYHCEAAGTGFRGDNTGMPVSGWANGPASAQWVGYPSTCYWTATSPTGAKTTITETLTTNN